MNGIESLVEFIVSSLFELAFGIILGAVGLFGFRFYTYLRAIPEVLASKRWPSVNGTIITSSVNRRYEDEGYAYQATIIYTYQVENIRHRSSRINSWRTLKGNYFNASKGFMEKYVAKYPVGNDIPVYYNPNNPEKAILERGFFPDSSEFFIFFGGAIFFLMGLGMVLSIVTGILDRIINLFL